MKKLFVFVFGLLAALAICGCQVQEEGELAPEGKVFTATMEAFVDDASDVDTKTSLDAGGSVLWKMGDQVSIFAGSTINEHYQVTDASDGKTAAALNRVESPGFVAGGDIDNNVAFYPYAEMAELAKNGSAYVIRDIALPATQTYATASFGNGAFPMTAVTSSTRDYNLKFKNVLGGLKLQLKGTATIASISITGNNNEVLCGDAVIDVSTTTAPSISLTDASAKTVILDCGNGVQLNETTATAFIIALPPMTMTGGFTVTVTDTEGATMEIKTTKTQTITRSNLLSMPAVVVQLSDAQPNNEIWYTSTDGNIVEPINTNLFAVDIESNTYENGKGIIRFSADLSQIGEKKYSYSSNKDALFNADNLLTIKLPESVRQIGTFAFFSCRNLREITLPEHLDYLGSDSFDGCRSIETITIPECEEIGGNPIWSSSLKCFYGPYSSEGGMYLIKDGVLLSYAKSFDEDMTVCTIPEGVTRIASYVFSGCDFVELYLPSTLMTIGSDSFGGMRNLRTIHFSEGLERIGMHAFSYCTSLDNVTLPSSLTSLDYNAFGDCTSLSHITIPDNVTIPMNPFVNCPNLASFSGKYASSDGRCLIDGTKLISFAPAGVTSFSVPQGITTIDWEVFKNCSKLENLEIPEGVSVIKYGCFVGCSSLKSLTLPSTWTDFDGPTFLNCSSLTQLIVKSVIPPVKGINTATSFLDNTNNCPIYVPAESVEAYKAAEVWRDYADRIQAIPNAQPNNEIWYTSTDGNIVVPNNSNMFGATLISNTYKDGKGVMSFDGPVTMVGDKSYPSSEYAPFNYCGNLYSISLPESVEMIGFCAFYGCSSLQTVKMPSHLVYLGNDPFEGTDIRTINIPETDDITVGNLVGGHCYNLEEITGPYASIDHRCLIIENSIRAFAPAGLDSYTIEEGITEIGHCAFWGCRRGPKLIVFPSTLKVISSQSFSYCSLETLVLPEGLERIGYAAFFDCRSLISVTLPSTLSYLDNEIFNHCTSLRSFSGKYASADGRLLVDNGSVKAFAPSGLTEYTIPEGITYATDGFDSYANLPSLKSLTLPSTLCTLALRGQSITTLTSLATTPPSVTSSDYLYLPTVEAIYVPAGSIDAYKTASYWSEYADKIQAIPSSAGGGNEGTSEEAWN